MAEFSLMNVLQNLQGGFQSPLFQSGAAMYNAGAQGQNFGGGFMAGAEAASTASKNLFQQSQQQRQVSQQQQRDQMWQGIMAGTPPPWAASLPRGTLDLARALGPDAGTELIAGMIRSIPQQQAQSERLKLAQSADARAAELHRAQMGQLKMASPEARAQMAQQYGIQPGTPEYRQFVLMGTIPDANKTQTSLQPVYGVDKDGNPVVMQPRSDGSLVQSQMPDGVTISRQPIKVEAGTETILLDPITRQPIARVPKNVAEVASLKEQGEAQGKAAADLPRLVDNASTALKTIAQIRSHPGKPYALGAAALVPGIPGTQQRGFINLVDQAKGQTFLEAFNSLRGGGQITEAEGAKATQALARLDRAQSPADFEQALADLEGVINAGLSRARGAAGRGPQLNQPQAAPQPVRPISPGAYVFDPNTGQLVPQGQSDRGRARTTIDGIDR